MKLHTLQYLRAIAALVVVYSHSVQQVPAYQALLPHKGAFGVDIFFVISGFIMVYIARAGDTPTRFMVNRIRRVVPLYWFFTLLMAAILLVLPGLFRASSFELSAVLNSLFFVPHFSIAHPEQVWPIVAPGWSLNYEMYFYLLFAASLLLADRYRLWFVGGVILLVVVIAALLPGDSAVLRFFRDTIVFEFVMGMALALAFKRGFSISPLMAWLLLLAGFCLIIPELPLPALLDTGVPALMIVIGTIYCRLPEYRWFTALGDASYSLYLSHIFTLGLCRKLFPPLLGDGMGSALVFVALCLVVCTVVGQIVHVVVDNWLLRKERIPGYRQRTVRD